MKLTKNQISAIAQQIKDNQLTQRQDYLNKHGKTLIKDLLDKWKKKLEPDIKKVKALNLNSSSLMFRVVKKDLDPTYSVSYLSLISWETDKDVSDLYKQLESFAKERVEVKVSKLYDANIEKIENKILLATIDSTSLEELINKVKNSL